jgi:hypothetical protein
MATCICGEEFEALVGKGQIKHYCSDRCRQRAKRRRDKNSALHLSKDVTPLLDQIMVGDCRELVKQIPDDSIDLIFTDPPYPKEFLPLYDWLAKDAARILKPGGFLLTYAGNMYLHDVMMSLGQHLTYFWHYIALDTGPGTVVWNKRTVARHKSILAYCKGSGQGQAKISSIMHGDKMHLPHATTLTVLPCLGKLYWSPLLVAVQPHLFACNSNVISSGLRST